MISISLQNFLFTAQTDLVPIFQELSLKPVNDSYLSTRWSLTWLSVPRSCGYLEMVGCLDKTSGAPLPHSLLTLNNNHTVGGIRAQAVGGSAAVLPTVAGLAVDDLDGDDAVSVSDGVDAVVKRLPRLKHKV